MTARLVLTNATAVLPDRVAPGTTLVAEGGLITDITEGPTTAAGALDLRGALLLPGIVDVHSDGLERERRPRPGTEVDPDFAVGSYEGRVRAAGVTTIFHGIGYQESPGKERTVAEARVLEQAVVRRAATGAGLVDHRLLLRLDARDPAGLAELREAVERIPADPSGALPLVSFEDHTPGQGQYADVEYFKAQMKGSRAPGGLASAPIDSLDTDFETLVAHREQRAWHRDVALDWLAEQALAGKIRLVAHDLAGAGEVAGVRARGAAIAEFPTTVEAARAARRHGMPVVVGAPNVLRGGSHSGNVGAAELIGEGLVDALASDYMPSTLLAAAVGLATDRVLGLPEAVRLVTAGPASVAGLPDRGALVPGLRADLTVVTLAGRWPTVRAAFLADEQRADDRPWAYAP